jgi:hypothetical protein
MGSNPANRRVQTVQVGPAAEKHPIVRLQKQKAGSNTGLELGGLVS